MKKKISAFVAVIACMMLSVVAIQPLTTNASSSKYDLDTYIEDMYKLYNYIFNDVTNANNNTNNSVNDVNNNVNTVNSNINSVNSSVNEVKEKVNNINVKKDLEEFFDNTKDESDTALRMGALAVPQEFAMMTNGVWDQIATTITSNDPGTDFGHYLGAVLIPDDSKYNTIVAIMRTLGYALVLVFFSVNLIEQTIKFEIFTVKGMLQIFGRLILAKIIIDVSVTICMAILRACGQISSQILNNNVMTLDGFVPSVNLATSDVKLIGPLIDVALSVLLSMLLLLVIFALLIATGFVLIRLVLRAIELTLLVTVSPAFFACAATETTRPYFRNFMLTFISVSAQVIFMAIVMYIGSITTMNKVGTVEITSIPEALTWISSIIPNAILIIAMCIMMVRPPKVLTNLIK